MKVITSPLIEPVSIAEVKAQMGIADERSDDVIARRIIEAREYVEKYTGRALITQTREIRWDCFVDRHELPSALTVVSLKYIDSDGIEQTLATSDYVLDTYAFIPFVRVAYGVSWPSVRNERNAVRIQYTAGYGPRAQDVPGLVREAIILLVGHWMNFQPNNESGISPSRVPFAVKDMLDLHKIEFL